MSKSAYLTIDDSPSGDFARKVDFLHQRQIPAVFFCRGDLLERNVPAAVRALELGFTLANHSYSHPHFSRLSVAECQRQIRRTDEIIGAVYKEAGVGWPDKYFRFPYGDQGDLKMGYLFSPLPVLAEPRGARLARWRSQLRALVRPAAHQREVRARQELGQRRKAQIQECLREHGYTCPAFEGVSYGYFRAHAQQDRDWIWTFDVMEWSALQARPLWGLRRLPDLIARLHQPNPPDPRGRVAEPHYGLPFQGSDEIILLHDVAETSALFYPLVEHLLGQGIRFQSS